VRVQDLAADLALAIRPRSVPGGSQQHVAAPAAVRTVIESIVRVLDARTKDPDFNGFSSY
jgi:hypothetical protein